MTVTSETNRMAEITTDGVETEFDFDLLIYDDDELQVWYKATGGSYGLLTLETDYNVVFTELGGTVSTDGYRAALAAGTLLIIRDIDFTQEANWLYNDNHSEQQHQDDFDRSVIRDLQIQEQLDRTVGFAIHSSTVDIEFPEPLSNNVIGWNTAATALENKDLVADIVALPAADGNFIVGDGTNFVVESGNTARTSLGLGTGDSPTFAGGTFTGVLTIEGLGTGGRTDYDLKVGDTTTPDYGMIQFGNAVIGRTSYKVGNIDLDGSILIQNIGGPVTGNIEFCFAESTGNSTRFALAKSGVGNATYNPRSMILAGPAPVNTDFVKVSYWQGQGIFDNLACDTVGSGADLAVQGSIECEVDIFCDSFKESTTGANITFADTVIAPTFNATDEVNAFQIDGVTIFATKSPDDVDGVRNLFIGVNAGIENTEGDDCVFIGEGAGKDNTTASGSVMIGFEAGRDQTTGGGHIFIGKWAGGGTASSTNPTGTFNVGIGSQSCGWKELTTGSDNFCLGATSGLQLSSGMRNIFIGRGSGDEITTESDNIFIGPGAGNLGGSNLCFGRDTGNSITGSWNTMMGFKSSQGQTSGSRNESYGYRSAFNNVTGTRCVSIGYESTFGVSGNSHSNVTALGHQAGYGLTTGSDNVFLGFKAGYYQTTLSDRLIIDNQTRTDAATEITNCLIYGIFDATVASQSFRINAGTIDFNGGVDNDLVINFLGTTNSGVLTWMEDEDYFKLSDDVAFADAEFLIFDKASGNGIKVDTATPTFGFADLLGDQFSKNTGGTKPTLVAYNGAVDAWQFSDGDEAFLTYHIPHDYVPGTDIHLHIHWSQNNAGATGGTIDFKYFAIYSKGHNQASGSVFGPATPITATFSSIDINDGGAGLTRYQQHLTEVTISAAAATAALFDHDDFEPDGVIELTLEMDANNLTGTPSDPFIHYADIHYQTTGLIGTKSRTPDFYA